MSCACSASGANAEDTSLTPQCFVLAVPLVQTLKSHPETIILCVCSAPGANAEGSFDPRCLDVCPGGPDPLGLVP